MSGCDLEWVGEADQESSTGEPLKVFERVRAWLRYLFPSWPLAPPWTSSETEEMGEPLPFPLTGALPLRFGWGWGFGAGVAISGSELRAQCLPGSGSSLQRCPGHMVPCWPLAEGAASRRDQPGHWNPWVSVPVRGRGNGRKTSGRLGAQLSWTTAEPLSSVLPAPWSTLCTFSSKEREGNTVPWKEPRNQSDRV